MTGLFTGFSVNVLSEPLNLIDFARYAVIDPGRNELRVRYWIRQPEGFYLHNVRIEVSAMRQHEQNRGETKVERLLYYVEPKDTEGVLQEEYGFIRGVRFVDVSLDQTKGCQDGMNVRETLKEMAEDKTSLCVSIIGTSADGRLITRRKNYRTDEILYGYGFLSIRLDELDNEWEKATDPFYEEVFSKMQNKASKFGRVKIKKISRYSLFHEHFDVVYRVRKRPDDDTLSSCYSAIPDYIYVFPPYVVAGWLYIPFRTVYESLQWIRRQLARIKKSSEKNA